MTDAVSRSLIQRWHRKSRPLLGFDWTEREKRHWWAQRSMLRLNFIEAIRKIQTMNGQRPHYFKRPESSIENALTLRLPVAVWRSSVVVSHSVTLPEVRTYLSENRTREEVEKLPSSCFVVHSDQLHIKIMCPSFPPLQHLNAIIASYSETFQSGWTSCAGSEAGLPFCRALASLWHLQLVILLTLEVIWRECLPTRIPSHVLEWRHVFVIQSYYYPVRKMFWKLLRPHSEGLLSTIFNIKYS